MNFRLACSNIAWQRHDDPAILALLRQYGATGIEVAPGKVWPNWQGADETAAARYREFLAAEGFQIPAMQAILFGRPELKVFDRSSHPAFLEHVRRLAAIAHALACPVLVYGAPGSRRRGMRTYAEAMREAADFFRQAGAILADADCVFGIEANPAEYQCDFLTNPADVREFVDLTASPGVKMHFDSGAVYLNGGDPATAVAAAGEFIHYHLSEPGLAPLGDGKVDQRAGLQALADRNYPHWISIEMRQGEEEKNALQKALQLVREAADGIAEE